jgi:quinol monooxygenase YgiN
MIIVIARFQPGPEHRDELIRILTEVQAASRLDDGCLNYGYYSEVVDSNSFIAVEEWRDQEALTAHLQTPHVALLIESLPRLGGGAPEIIVHEVAGSGPMQIPR